MNKKQLHELIQSLSGNEKRYISISLKNEKNNNQLSLFKAIEGQNEFNENKLRGVLQRESFVSYLPVIKHYLYDTILTKLNGFYSSTSSSILLYQLLIKAEILHKKNLYSHLNEKLSKIKKLAEKNEDFLVLLKCCEWDRIIINNTPAQKNMARNLNSIFETTISLSKKVENINAYKALSEKLTLFTKKIGEARQRSQKERVITLLKHPLLQHEKMAMSDSARYYYFFLRTTCFNFLGQYSNALQDIESLLLLLAPNKSKDKSSLERYARVLNNKSYIQIEMQKYAEAQLTLRQLRLLKDEKKLPEATLKWVLGSSYSQEISLYMSTSQYEYVLEMIPEIERFIKRFSDAMDQETQTIFYYVFSYVHFILRNYKKTLFYLGKILNYKNADLAIREDIYCYSKILQVITHYEKGTENLVESLLRSTFSFLRQRKRLFKIENAFLTFMNDMLIKNKNSENTNKNLWKFRQEIKSVMNKNFEKKSLEYFDFISWIESKVSKRPFIDVLKEKHNSKHGTSDQLLPG